MGSIGGNNVPEKFTYQRSSDIKEWSAKEEQRTREASDMVDDYSRRGDSYEEYYELTDVEEVYREEIGAEYGFRDGTEVTIWKDRIVYAGNWDENNNRVKQGKAVTGTTVYSVAIDGDKLDDSHMFYKTVADAKHDLALNLDYYKQREAYNKAKKRG